MRMLSMVLAAMALLQVAGWAEAKDRTQPGGGGYVDTKHPKLGKDYYVVRMRVGDKCSIVSGEWSSKPAGALGGAPYASRDYAKAALKRFPECKGGEIEEAADEKD
jgi:hypothetical protein